MSSIGEIKGEFENASRQEWPALYEKYGSDSRSGVQKLLEQYHKKEAAYQAELVRTESLKVYEHKYEHLGYVCGIDEVGRTACRSGSSLCRDPSQRLSDPVSE